MPLIDFAVYGQQDLTILYLDNTLYVETKDLGLIILGLIQGMNMHKIKYEIAPCVLAGAIFHREVAKVIGVITIKADNYGKI